MSKLRECPSCGCSGLRWGNRVMCVNMDCVLMGPENDVDGAKWNALPRRSPPGCVCAETSSRNCPVHANQDDGGIPPAPTLEQVAWACAVLLVDRPNDAEDAEQAAKILADYLAAKEASHE